MDLKRARDLIENVFSKEFDRETFIKFASNLLNSNFNQSSILQGNQIPEEYKDGIGSLEILSNYIDSSGKKIDFLNSDPQEAAPIRTSNLKITNKSGKH